MIILQTVYSFVSYFRDLTEVSQIWDILDIFRFILKGYNRASFNQLIYFQNGLTLTTVRLALQLGPVRSWLISG